ncbi:atherin-like, partial [Capsicum annuum]|uniref:atherin-like n=1 Tax=Capsicum annuum TaxID=4072 RepID=UPI001FB101F9
ENSLSPRPGPRPSAPSPTVGADADRRRRPDQTSGPDHRSPALTAVAGRTAFSLSLSSLSRLGPRPRRRCRPSAPTRFDLRPRPPINGADPRRRPPVPVPPPAGHPPFSVHTPHPPPLAPVQQPNSRSSVFNRNSVGTRRSVASSRRSVSAAKSPGSRSTRGLVTGSVYKRNP